MSYAFTFDASACTGCKACQEACKDKNKLPLGILWRRIFEVSGGEWHTAGNAWQNSVFAYNFSLACNHCTHPKCAGVCPTDAYTVRPDGIVLIDEARCMGCGYCAWACPYGVPQYDAGRGVMTKCNFCCDDIDAGQPPSCVAACPLRVLDYKPVEKLESVSAGQNLWQLPASQHPFPLPDYSRTEPHLTVKLHAGMGNSLAKTVANIEEILPPRSFEAPHRKAGNHELPLVAFTLLVQTAGGMAIGSLLLDSIPLTVLISIGIFLGVGGLISFLHLGRKRNAWRAVIHIKKSWLSREVVMASLFGAAWVVAVGTQADGNGSPAIWVMALLGAGLIYSMGRVYQLRAVAEWNNWRTLLSFFLSAAILGSLGIMLATQQAGWAIVAGFGLVGEAGLILTARNNAFNPAGMVRLVLIAWGIIGAFLISISLPPVEFWQAVLLLLIALADEIIGRWQFYARRKPFPIPSG